MSDTGNCKPIIIGNLEMPYSKLLLYTGFEKYSIELADKYLHNFSNPQKAAKHLLHAQSIKSSFWGSHEIFLTDDNSDVVTSTSTAFTVMQLSMVLAIAHLAGLELSNPKVQEFVELNFGDSSKCYSFGPDEDIPERIGNALAHMLINTVSSEIVGKKAYRTFFKKKK